MNHPRRRGFTLRTRLVAVVVLLLFLVSTAVGAATELVLHHYLLGRLDAQLASAQHRRMPGADGTSDGFGFRDPDGPPGEGGDRGVNQPGNAVGTIGAVFTNGKLDGNPIQINDSGGVTVLGTAAANSLGETPRDAVPHSRHVAGLGNYRVLATPTTDGGSSVVTVTGLPLSSVNQTVLHVLYVELAAIGAGLLLAGFAGATTIRIALRPLRRVAATATRVTELELDRGEVALADRVPERDTDPRTEVGQVGVALNSLLGHVDAALTARQASEMRVRQFVADASHELRTPLAVIRGYAELTRRGREQAPVDIAHALTRVESEAERMTTLVEDLLLLARLDSGRPLETRPVDLTSMLVDTVSDAHAAGPDHVWRLDVPDEAVEVPGDEARLHQVFANLLANARTHTPPGTPVTVSLRVEGDNARITVADAGPGVPAELAPTVFERFARGDGSRSRAAGSTGLGLAIVSAVTAAHRGSVTLESVPGRTVFGVVLPVTGSPSSV